MITLFAAQSADGFICDRYGNGDFSGPEDKAQLRAFLRSDECGGFIMGRKTADQFAHLLPQKPLYILTRSHRIDWMDLSRNKNLALLGGAQTYRYFLALHMVDEARITTENIAAEGGIPLEFTPFADRFDVVSCSSLSKNATLTFYKKK
jgi:dihydrofolate reductase